MHAVSPTISRTRVWLQRALVVAVWMTAVVLWRRYQAANGLTAAGSTQRFVDEVGAVWWGVLAYVGVYLLRPVVLFPASLLTVVGGVIFGPVVGVIVVIVAANSSAMIAYLIGRLLGTPHEGHQDDAAGGGPPTFLARWATRMRENSFETLLVMRFLFLPYDLVNYGAGALRIGWMPFLAATALGSLPGTVSFVLLGASLDRVDQGLSGIDPVALAGGVVIFVAGLVVARQLKARQTASA